MIKRRWAVWELANDEEAYGEHAGGFIIVTDDGESEVTGIVCDEETALHIVRVHNETLGA